MEEDKRALQGAKAFPGFLETGEASPVEGVALQGREKALLQYRRQKGHRVSRSMEKSAAVMMAVMVFLMSGCSWYRSYGKVRALPRHEGKLTLQGLRENWQDYTISYAGASAQQPSAIMFDPKMDDRSLVSDKWIRVEDQETLSELIGWIQSSTQFPPRLQRILGPNDQFFGYFYSGWDHVVLKVVDDNTLWVHDLPVAPDHYYNGDGDERATTDPPPAP